MDISSTSASARLTQSFFDTQRNVGQEQKVAQDSLDKTKENLLNNRAKQAETANKVAQQRTETNAKLANKIDTFA